MQEISSPSGPCSDSPTYLQSVYTNSTEAVGTFTDKEFGGYLCSGSIYLDEICVGNSCKVMKIYAATLVSQNAWLYDQDGAYGILGYGPNSAFWNQYIDTTGVATYSIELATVKPLQQNQADLAISNITFGSSGNQAIYLNQPSLVISTDAGQDVLYAITELGFGTVYQTNGADSSSYFANLTSSSNVLFNTNFQGLGLPSELYTQYTTLLTNLTDSATCEPVADGVCVLSSACSSNQDLLNFSFQIMFQSNSSYYIRVPLATFAISTSDNKCELAVSELSSENMASSNVVLGGMFFQEFFGVFMNQYNQTTGSLQSQTAQFYIQRNNNYNASYVGNEMLPMGTNPFYTPVPTPTPTPDDASVIWIIILCVIVVLLAGFLGWAIYKWRQSEKQQEDKRYVVYNTEDKQELLASQGDLQGDSEL